MAFREKGRLIACAVGVALLCLLVVPVASSTPTGPQTGSRAALSSQILRELNRVRAQHGLQPLALSAQLNSAASNHSRSMANDGYFTHESSNGTAFWQRIRHYYGASGFHYWAVGENLVWASPDLTAKMAVQMWMNSPPHRANLLSARWHQIGLSAVHSSNAPGTFKDRAVTIVTADFGVRR